MAVSDGKQFSGAARGTTLAVAITGGSTSIQVTDGSTFPSPTGTIPADPNDPVPSAALPFVITLDRASNFEEKVLISSRSGNVLTVETRGYDGTAATSHAEQATVEHTIDAFSLTRFMEHVGDPGQTDAHNIDQIEGLETALETATVPVGGIIMYSGSLASLSVHWHLCDGTSGTPDLRNRFVVGSGSTYSVGSTGGSDTVALTASQMPAHNHSEGGLSTDPAGAHTHEVDYDSVTTYDGTGAAKTVSKINSSGSLSSTSQSAGSHAHNVSGSTSVSGSSQAHENRPPYYALAYVMRVS